MTRANETSPWTIEELRKAPAFVPVPAYAAGLGVSADVVYEAIQRRELCALRLGRRLLLPTAPLLEAAEMRRDQNLCQLDEDRPSPERRSDSSAGMRGRKVNELHQEGPAMCSDCQAAGGCPSKGACAVCHLQAQGAAFETRDGRGAR